MLPTRTISVSIRRAHGEVYAFLSAPANFARWAAGLGQGLRHDGAAWVADTPVGRVEITFSPTNAHGVVDHHVKLPGGAVVSVPLRVIQNEDGAEVVFTLFRQPDMTDADFARDGDAITKDLATLKALLER